MEQEQDQENEENTPFLGGGPFVLQGMYGARNFHVSDWSKLRMVEDGGAWMKR